ncbi:MAG: hypothetical protein ABID45_02420 [Patescibacteria group bacterium]
MFKKVLIFSIILCFCVLLPVASKAVLTADQLGDNGFSDSKNTESLLYKHKKWLFAYTNQTELYKWIDATNTWQEITDVDVVTDKNNQGFSTIPMVWKGNVLLFVNNDIDGARVYASELGTYQRDIFKKNKNKTFDWYQINEDGFGNANTGVITARWKYKGDLFVAVQNQNDLAEIWKAESIGERVRENNWEDSVLWTQMGTEGLDDSIEQINTGNKFKGDFYIGTEGGGVYVSSDNENWTLVEEFDGSVTESIKLKSKLVVSEKDITNGVKLHKTKNGEDFEQINTAGFGNKNNVDVSFLRKNWKERKIIAITENNVDGFEMYATKKMEKNQWEEKVNTGIDSENNTKVTDFIKYKGRKYLATYNSEDGTAVYRFIRGDNQN